MKILKKQFPKFSSSSGFVSGNRDQNEACDLGFLFPLDFSRCHLVFLVLKQMSGG